MVEMSKKLRGKKYKIKKLKLPKVITEDLTYYMQFGWHRVREVENGKYQKAKHDNRVYTIPDYYG